MTARAEDELPEHAARLARSLAEPEAPASDTPQAVVSMLLSGAADDLEVLLMRRIEHPEDPWSGHVSLPGGHVDPEDEDLFASAVRETREEVGLDLARSGRWLGCLPTVDARRQGLPIRLSITPFVFLRTDEHPPSAGPEAQEVFWFPLARAAAGDLDTTHRVRFEERTHELPAWTHEGRLVWGLTHRMLRTLLERLRAPS